MAEAPMRQLYDILERSRVRTNLIQTGAIGVQICMDDKDEKTNDFAAQASNVFDVQLEKDLHLLTIRHYNETLVNKMLEGKEVVLMQKTKETIQALYK